MLIVTKQQNQIKIHAIFNNIDRTSFFLKARMISDNIIGTAVVDASYRCVLTDLTDGKFIAVAGSAG